MSAVATETVPKVNGDTTYSSKFLPKITAIPLINSLMKQFSRIPQAEALSKIEALGQPLFEIQPMLIKLDTLAANGMAKLERDVPIVTTPTNEVLKKAKIDSFIGVFGHYYVASVDFVNNFFNAYKGFFDPAVNTILKYLESSLNVEVSKEETQKARVTRIRLVIIEKVDSKVTPILNKTNEKISSIFSKTTLVTQYSLNHFNDHKDRVVETCSPLVSELTSRYRHAESAAKTAWVKTKPDFYGPSTVIPSVKSGIHTVMTFGYHLAYPGSKEASPNAVDEQTNGLASGVELKDGETKKRFNMAS